MEEKYLMFFKGTYGFTDVVVLKFGSGFFSICSKVTSDEFSDVKSVFNVVPFRYQLILR